MPVQPRESSHISPIIGVPLLIATIGIGLLTAVWLFIMIVLPKYPAPQASLAMSEGATVLVLAALSNALPGQPVQVDRRFGNNLNLHIDGKTFEEMADYYQDDVIEQIGRAWCANVEHSWLARVSIYDRSDGTRLCTHVCVWGKLKDTFFKQSSWSDGNAPRPTGPSLAVLA